MDWGVPTFAPYAMSNQVFGQVGFGQAWYYADDPERTLHWWYDEESNLWTQWEIAYTANSMGIVDPDSPIQTYDDWRAKRDAGQYISVQSDYMSVPFNTAHAAEGKGYEPLAPTGGNWYADGHQERKTGGFAFYVTKNCKDPDAAMRWINYMCSYDGNLMLNNGIKGLDWDIGADGKPFFTDSYIQQLKEGTSRDITGIGYDTNYMGLEPTQVDPRYGTTVRFTVDRVMSAVANTALDEDYSKFYDAVSPTDAMEKAFEDGRLKDYAHINTALGAFIETMPTDLARIVTNTSRHFEVYSAKFFACKSQSEFEQLKEEALAAFKAEDPDGKVMAWYNEQFARAVAATE